MYTDETKPAIIKLIFVLDFGKLNSGYEFEIKLSSVRFGTKMGKNR